MASDATSERLSDRTSEATSDKASDKVSDRVSDRVSERSGDILTSANVAPSLKADPDGPKTAVDASQYFVDNSSSMDSISIFPGIGVGVDGG